MPPRPSLEATDPDRAAVYAGIPNRPDAPDNLFQIAVAFEILAEGGWLGRGRLSGLSSRLRTGWTGRLLPRAGVCSLTAGSRSPG